MKTRPIPYLLVLVIWTVACAPYAANTPAIRNSLSAGDYTGAYDAVQRAARGPSKLLFFLETGLIAHYDGQYAHSNVLLDQAERIADELFTRSLSRELAAFVTSDESRDYRGETYELVFIHYYRALNYWYLGLPENALVECRKANLRLERYTSHDETEFTYKNDAFIHYLTALFYESELEYNDAYVSLRDAEMAYRRYASHFRISAPAELDEDLARVEAELGYAGPPALTALQSRSGNGDLVVFTEIGFISRKIQEEVDIPIYKSDLDRARKGSTRRISHQVRDRHRRGHHHASKVDYWMRIALPAFETPHQDHTPVRVLIGNESVTPSPAQNLDTIARATLEDRSGNIFARTVARALVKLAATKGAEKKSEWLGFLVNMFTAATEKADTRSWVTLPREVRIGRIALPPGEHEIRIQRLDRWGIVTDETVRTIRIEAGRRTFINHRQYS